MNIKRIADLNDDQIDQARSWIKEAGDPYFTWLFGDSIIANQVVSKWMNRKSSEIHSGRIRYFEKDGLGIGGYIALTGEQLLQCRKADAFNLLNAVEQEERADLMARAKSSSQLFSIPCTESFYLSKIGVSDNSRGMGLGKCILGAYLKEGRELGFTHFSLDVATDNHHARTMYRKIGFEEYSESCDTNIQFKYIHMTLTEYHG